MSEQIFENPSLLPEVNERINELQVLRHLIVEKAFSLVGAKSIKYTNSESGLEEENGFDCSGFINHILTTAASEHNINLVVPRHANELWREFGEMAAYGQRRAGDLVFFPSKQINGIRLIGHVGLVVSKTEYIHAPGKDDSHVCVDALPGAQKEFEENHPDDLYTLSPAGVKRLTPPCWRRSLARTLMCSG
jgi:hypothetical protein